VSLAEPGYAFAVGYLILGSKFDCITAEAIEEVKKFRRCGRRPYSFFAHLFGPCVEPGYRPIHLPKFYIVAVNEPPGGFDGGLIINTIQLNHANRSVV
jgi:hypothetical protein